MLLPDTFPDYFHVVVEVSGVLSLLEIFRFLHFRHANNVHLIHSANSSARFMLDLNGILVTFSQ